MSVIDSCGAQVHLERCPVAIREAGPAAPATSARKPRSPKVRLRDQRWLFIKRTWNFSIDDLAEFVGKDRTTVARGVAAAKLEEEAGAAGAVDLTEDFIYDIQHDHPLGTPIGDHPDVRAFFAGLNVPQYTREQLRGLGRTGHHARRRELTNTVSRGLGFPPVDGGEGDEG